MNTVRRTPQDGARDKGAQAFRDGKTERDCPYQDKRSTSGRLTYSRTFIVAWLDGYRREKRKADDVRNGMMTGDALGGGSNDAS